VLVHCVLPRANAFVRTLRFSYDAGSLTQVKLWCKRQIAPKHASLPTQRLAQVASAFYCLIIRALPGRSIQVAICALASVPSATCFPMSLSAVTAIVLAAALIGQCLGHFAP